MRLIQGAQCQQFYAAVGRTVSAELQGIQHSKTFSCGPYLITGSANWTTPTAFNQELSVLIRMSNAGVQAHQTFTSRLVEDSVEINAAQLAPMSG